jgi:Site-specific recombinase XerD
MERARPNTHLPEALQDYEDTHMAFRNMAPRTRVEYRRDLDDVVGFLETSSGIHDPGDVEMRHLEYYLADLDRRGLSGSSRRRKTAAIKSFFSFLEGHRYVANNVAARLRPPSREAREPRVLTEAEYRRLQDACRFNPRDQAIIELFLQTGMRLSELARLTVSDLNLPAKVSKEE